MARDKACKQCHRIVDGSICPMCKSTELTRSWRGTVVIIDPESEIAETMGITAPGKYVIEIK